MIRNLKKFGASEENLIEVYIQQIRSISEMACPVWNSGITQQEVRSLERVQNTALAIIRGNNYSNYSESLKYFNIDTLKDRRETLCLKFAIKAFKHPKFSSWFAPNEGIITRSGNSNLKLKVL